MGIVGQAGGQCFGRQRQGQRALLFAAGDDDDGQGKPLGFVVVFGGQHLVDALHQRVVGLYIGCHGHGDGQVDVVVLMELAADFGLQLSHSNLASCSGRAVCEQGGVYQ